MKVQELAVLLEVYYTYMEAEELVGTALYGSSYAVGFEDSLFGRITKLYNVFKNYIHESWYSDMTAEYNVEETAYYQLIMNKTIPWDVKAEILMKEKQN